jgi:hypothetical protein
MREGDGYPKCFDPYLLYAISTCFENFGSFDEEKSRLFFLVEFREAKLAEPFARKMKRAGYPVDFGPADDDTRYRTVRTGRQAVLEAAALALWEQYVSRVELSLPLMPAAASGIINILAKRWHAGKGSLLLGVIDDGCPFAAAQFLRSPPGAAAMTRVLAVWDQNQGRQPVDVDDSAGNPCQFGQPLPDFTYGLEYRRDSVTPGGAATRQMGLDEWAQLHSTPAGSIDEDGCYAHAKFTTLARRQSHGAHVMDVLAGRLPTSSRIGPSGPGQDRRGPPRWKAGKAKADPASHADVVFVQFPDDCIRDATGVWLKAYVVDGVRYILSCADPNRTKHVVINLSYGPTTGPHDGTAELEAALRALVLEYDGSAGKPRLEIVLAAGNAYLSEGHVVFERDGKQPAQVEWTWRLPPDNAALCFAEVWMKSADATGVAVSLTSPTGALRPVGGPIAWGTDTMWRLDVGPTIAEQNGVPAEHGDWKITVTGVGVNARVDAYVARTDPNMGVRTGAKRSYFVDARWEQTRSAAASCTRAGGEFDKADSLVRRDGTLNGIATDKDPHVHVAGGYIIADRCKSPYSSAGPARSGPRPLRVGPDLALPGDESYALGGIRAGGNRSGSVFRLTGTSAAAPQLARQLAKKSLPGPTDVPTGLPDIRKRGGGNLEPP